MYMIQQLNLLAQDGGTIALVDVAASELGGRCLRLLATRSPTTNGVDTTNGVEIWT